ncbi:hypothetical protein DPMN_000441 [Dreissena polymorpha]|uniref:Uncharacterized protein n=1 Tax=Dreissena polymorpha TaxID=45954 RepID=A0A9D4MJ03_DREPO|nr:hypothetical protein DPMN_000441 [Dreissena polymorpha]
MFGRDGLQKHRDEIKEQLLQRGYNGRFVETKLKKIDSKKREDLLRTKVSSKSTSRVPLVITFSRALPNVGHILRKHLPTLHTSDCMKMYFLMPR